MTPDPATHDLATRRRRARYRAWHRGTQEMDIILGHFADAHVPEYGEEDLARLEALMDELDTELLKWVMGQTPPPDHVDAALVRQLTDFHTRRTQAR